MTGSIQIKRGRANYYAVLNTYDSSGRRKPKWIDTTVPVKGNNKRKAEARLKELLVKYSEEDINLCEDTYFTEFMYQWLETRRTTKAIAITTYDGYRLVFDSHIKPYFEPLKLKVRDLTPALLTKYVNVKTAELSPNTVIKHLHNISKCLDSAIKQNIIAFNLAKRIDWPQKVRYTGAKCLNPLQIEELLVAVKGDVLETIILFGIFYGLRRSEILGIKRVQSIWTAISSLSSIPYRGMNQWPRGKDRNLNHTGKC
jgi:integrase